MQLFGGIDIMFVGISNFQFSFFIYVSGDKYTLKNAGLNTTQHWVKYGWTQRLGCLDPAVGLLPLIYQGLLPRRLC